MITARRFVRSHKNGISDREGNRASSTVGIVSPTMTQKATIPPNALHNQHLPVHKDYPMYVQYPLRHRNGYKTRPAKAMFDGRLERIGTAELRVDDYQLDSPVNDYSESNEEEGACNEASVAKSVGLPDDACSSALCQPPFTPKGL